MVASLKIVRTCLALWVALIVSAFFVVAPAAYAGPMHVKVQEGDTAFLVDADKGEIWWITETCRHEVPVARDDKSSDKPTSSISSERFVKDVQIGSHRFKLEQEFRFDRVNQTPTLQVYNSARGGWSEIDIRVDDTCDLGNACRRRMELPLCLD